MDAPPLAAAPPLRVSPELPLEIVEDIFIRVPPEDCALLLRAGLACKTWGRLFASRGFSRRYRQRHRGAAPLLGFLANLADTGGAARFVPAAISSGGGGGFRPFRADSHGYRAHDARHGRVLLSRVSTTNTTSAQSIFLAVWVPITGDTWRLPPLLRHRPVRSWNAAVICDPFRVVVVGMDTRELFVYTYVPEAHAWFPLAAGKPVSDQLDADVAGVRLRRTPPRSPESAKSSIGRPFRHGNKRRCFHKWEQCSACGSSCTITGPSRRGSFNKCLRNHVEDSNIEHTRNRHTDIVR
ncbi:hypothetical protein HU200_027867 [Digitaria exilis]|uniref:F-box domain-containing protein n=1 Tax=Digitaria exilis TaxID=1010633 RepID=A0A835BV19_9POAL|nr:hypothetical protein HU200_027867 [Digitaria exilis]